MGDSRYPCIASTVHERGRGVGESKREKFPKTVTFIATPSSRQTFNATTPDGAVQIDMLFQDSGFVDDWVLASRPVHTLAVTATSLDGKSHAVQASARR